MIPPPVYDESTGDLVPQEWERVLPNGEIRIESGDPEEMASEVFDCLSRLASAYQAHGTLPTAGGWLDQPARVLLGMRLVAVAREAVEKRIETKRGEM